MIRNWIPFWLAVVMVLGFPRLVFCYLELRKSANVEQDDNTTQIETIDETAISVLTEAGHTEMPLNEYLVGVLLAEIPGEFHVEAQKAQAVVARTYALRTIQFKGKHDDSAICTNSECCQGYRSPEDYLKIGGSPSRIQQARYAVDETSGEILKYSGAIIDATYFSCSGGQTEDALAVWGVDIPYLQSVSSPGEEGAIYFTDRTVFTYKAFQEAVGRELSGSPSRWFGGITYTRGGGVESMLIGGKLYTGTEIRTILGLRSTAFEIAVSNDSIVITTKGFGHRVGMSQYGAQAMALKGSTHSEILAHYYPGTVIDKEAIFS